jgi:hypothetical protein
MIEYARRSAVRGVDIPAAGGRKLLPTAGEGMST